jgi:hypothetical protein
LPREEAAGARADFRERSVAAHDPATRAAPEAEGPDFPTVNKEIPL